MGNYVISHLKAGVNMNVYIVRHGETDCNVNNICYGWYDCPLNEKGITQAKNLGNFLKTKKIDKIISSDLLRARMTADEINKELMLPVEYNSSLREIFFGDWENKPVKEMMKIDPVNTKLWREDCQKAVIPNGELFDDFYARVSTGFDKIVEENFDKDILIVAHGGAISALLCHITDAGAKGFWHFRTIQECYTKLVYDYNGFFIERINSPIK